MKQAIPLIAAALLVAIASPAHAMGPQKPASEQGAESTTPSVPPGPTQEELDAKCKGNLCVGDRAYLHANYYKMEEVVLRSKQPDGRFMVASAETGNLIAAFDPKYLAVAAGNLQRISCLGDRCLGESVILVDSYHETQEARIVGIAEPNPGDYFYTVMGKAGLLGFFTSGRLARIHDRGLFACSQDLCVGDTATLNAQHYDTQLVTIAGIMPGGNMFVVKSSVGIPFGPFYKAHLGLVSRREPTQAERDTQEVRSLEKDPAFELSIYQAARAQGQSHRDAVEAAKGPYWYGAADTGRFLGKLSGYVYQFDAAYLQGLLKLIPSDANRERASLFIAGGLLPYLRDFGYAGLKEKFINPSVKNIQAKLGEHQITSIADTESSVFSRRLALQMLGVSLQTAMIQMDPGQKERASEALRVIAASLGGSLRVRDLGAFMSQIPALEKLLLELAQNPYLQSRAATDLGLLYHVRNS
ncbi:MAG: hypothetical protein NDJ90_10625 [Oligoflexia bacterium]|nr:hypothetical protein [Oligoflexia bacterium]